VRVSVFYDMVEAGGGVSSFLALQKTLKLLKLAVNCFRVVLGFCFVEDESVLVVVREEVEGVRLVAGAVELVRGALA